MHPRRARRASFMPDRIAVVGLGKLGASMAAAFASRGCDVIGVDVDAASVALVNDGQAPVQETDLAATIAAHRARLRATTSHADAVRHADVSFVIVPTPSVADGGFSLRYVEAACTALGEAIGGCEGYHLVVLTSTVLPGASRHVIVPVLERASGKQAGRDFGFCYSPEFIALGSVIRNFLHPDFTLVGEWDARSGDTLEALYQRTLATPAPCRRMSLENAELAKVALNAFVTTKISFANMLADLCERLPGGDVDAVTAALGSDPRIGRRYLTGALGFGGPCFPRDNHALSSLAASLGVSADLPDATDCANRRRAWTVVDLVGAAVPTGATVAVLGLAYKPASHVVEASQALEVAAGLAAAGYRVVAWDPLISPVETAARGLTLLASAEACLACADAVVVATPDPAFAAIDPARLAAIDGGPRLVVDCWRHWRQALEHRPGVHYVAIGLSADDDDNRDRLATWWARRR